MQIPKGLYLRGEVWRIDKIVRSGKATQHIRQTTGCKKKSPLSSGTKSAKYRDSRKDPCGGCRLKCAKVTQSARNLNRKADI